jgi:hypothetical protein
MHAGDPNQAASFGDDAFLRMMREIRIGFSICRESSGDANSGSH